MFKLHESLMKFFQGNFEHPVFILQTFIGGYFKSRRTIQIVMTP